MTIDNKENILVRQIDVANAINTALRRFYDEKMNNLADVANLLNDELTKIQLFFPQYGNATLEGLKAEIDKVAEIKEQNYEAT